MVNFPPRVTRAPRCSAVAWVGAIILVLGAADCSRKLVTNAGSSVGSNHGGSSAMLDASAAQGVAALDAGQQLDAGPARVVSLVLSVEPTEQPGKWVVMGRVPDLALNFTATSFVEPALCG